MNILENAIQTTIVKQGKKELHHAFHVGLAGTFDYISHLGMMIMSISRYNPDMDFVFHLFVNRLPEDEDKHLDMVAAQTGNTIKIHVVNDEAFSSIIFGQYNASFFYRFIMPDIVCGETDRLLYMDGDMMCRGSLRELMELDLGDSLAGVVSDRDEKRQMDQMQVQGFFNSGLMLIHVAQWVKNNMLAVILQFSQDNLKYVGRNGRHSQWKHALYNDQNILNKVLDGKVIWLPKKYNYIYKLNRSALFRKKAENEDYHDQIILHFAGSVKPWHDWAANWPVVKEYRKIWLDSPWKDVPPSAPKSRKDCHQAAREYRVTGQYGKALHWYLEYYKRKL